MRAKVGAGVVLRALALAVTAGLGVAMLAGCGGGPAASSAGSTSSPVVSAADQDCRDSWAELAVVAQERARIGADLRQAFASRWNAVEAGVDYYVQVADPSACGDLLEARRRKVERLDHLVARTLPYDAGQRRTTAFALRGVYATLPKGAKTPKSVKQAYAALAKQTPKAAEDLAPAYAELARVDPGNSKAVPGPSPTSSCSRTQAMPTAPAAPHSRRSRSGTTA